ncbi:hypothetical protein [Koleobacter methoxysyntrophicus]|uniref:hypothetical protein n=1 Tax=Koleobacter methoxysyntrophicus TaxID=2751313 RepID=UPI0019D69E4D|nr:hypothetical protein [Koleobacter methoxysyntrophicus]
MKKTIEVRVRCSGELHRIVLNEKGQLVLCNHREPGRKKADMVTMALTGRKLRCYEVLNAWREAIEARWRFSTRRLPKALKDAVLHCRKITEMHSTRKPLPLELYLRKDKTSFFAEKIREAWGRAHRSVPSEMQLRVGYFPKISPCFVRKVKDSTVFTYPKFSWCIKVYKRGLGARCS